MKLTRITKRSQLKRNKKYLIQSGNYITISYWEPEVNRFDYDINSFMNIHAIKYSKCDEIWEITP